MNKEERITYEEFMIMYRNVPRFAYTLYDKAEDEIDRLNNIIKIKTDFIQDLLEIIYFSDDNILHTKAHLIGEEYNDKLKELKENNKDDN